MADDKRNVETMRSDIRNQMRQFSADADSFASYLEIQGRLHRISAANAMLVMQQKADASLVFGYNTWKNTYHRNVRRGQKAIYILAPHKYPYRTYADRLDANGNPVRDANGTIIQDPVQKTGLYYTPVPVFDIAQTHGEDFPEITNQERIKADPAYGLDRMEEACAYPVEYSYKRDGRTRGYMDNGTIVLNGNTGYYERMRDLVRVTAQNEPSIAEYPLITRQFYAAAVTYAVCSAYGIPCDKPSPVRCKEVFGDKKDAFLSDFLRSVRNQVHGIMDGVDIACERQKEAEKAEAEKAEAEKEKETETQEKEKEEEKTNEEINKEPEKETEKEPEKEEAKEENKEEAETAEEKPEEKEKPESEKETTEAESAEKETTEAESADNPSSATGKEKEKITDFGEKIGGARKDIAAMKRGINPEDIEKWTEAERRRFIKKDAVWKRPDYKQLKADGVPVEILYATKVVRDAMPSAPVYLRSSTPEKDQNNYVAFVADVRDKMNSIIDGKDIENLGDLSKWLIKNDYLKQTGVGILEVTDKAPRLVTNKLYQAFSRAADPALMQYEIKRKKFLYSEEDKALQYVIFGKLGDTITIDPQEQQLVYREGMSKRYFHMRGGENLPDMKPGTWVAVDDVLHRILTYNASSMEEARDKIVKEWMEAVKTQAEAKKERRKQSRSSLTPPMLENIERIGGDDVRHGRNVTGDDFIRDFGFKGGEFGNWLSEKDRQASLNAAYDAFHDLAKALNISDKDISFNGELSIAFGSRGRGGKGSALAHYEPFYKVINLTKMKGAGSLAHEWIHALDDAIGRQIGVPDTKAGTMVSPYAKVASMPAGSRNVMSAKDTDVEVPEGMKKLVHVLHYNPLTKEEFLKQNKDAIAQKLRRIDSYIGGIVQQNPLQMTDEEINRSQDLLDKLEAEASKSTQYSYYQFADDGKMKSDKTMTPAYEALAKYAKSIGHPELMKPEWVRWYNMCRSDLATLNDSSDFVKNCDGENWRAITPKKEVESRFYSDAKTIDGQSSKTYWSTPYEMLARAGAVYILDKLKSAGVRNDYLTGHAEYNGWLGMLRLSSYPVGSERERIDKAFDTAIQDLKERGILHEREPERSREEQLVPSDDSLSARIEDAAELAAEQNQQQMAADKQPAAEKEEKEEKV